MKKIKYILFLFIMLFINSCKCNKGIKDLVTNNNYLKNHFNFKVISYYNSPNTYREMPLEIGQIRHGAYEMKDELELYERTLDLFFETYFPNGVEKINDEAEYEKCMNNISSFCEIVNEDNQLLFWIVPQPKNEKFMIVNGFLIKNIDEISDLLIVQ